MTRPQGNVQFIHTTRFRRGKLPHWEVQNGRYFVTVRLADSLPHDVVLLLQEIHRTLANIAPQSDGFAALQRKSFRTMEKYLDAGSGACCLREPGNAATVVRELGELAEWKVTVPHYVIMPNHWHALVCPTANCIHSLGEIMKRLKGRTAKSIRRAIGGSGPVWQREWFDRWIRDEAEWSRTVGYIRQNPVKAGMVSHEDDYRWVR